MHSQMARFGRFRPPIIVTAIGVLHRCAGEFRVRGIVQRSELDRHIVSADLLEVPAAEAADAAMAAKEVMDTSGAELIVAQRPLPGKQAKGPRLDDD